MNYFKQSCCVFSLSLHIDICVVGFGYLCDLHRRFCELFICGLFKL